MAIQLTHLPKTPCRGPPGHQRYIYSIGSYYGCRKKCLCDTAEKSTTIAISNSDMDPMLTYLKGGKSDATVAGAEYRLIYRSESGRYPHCIYMLLQKSEPASKASLDRFLSPSGENGWKIVMNSELLPIHSTVPSSQYEGLYKKFAHVDSYIPTRIVQEVQRRCSSIADEQDAALEEIKRKLTRGELDITFVLMEMTKLVQNSRKVSEDLALAMTHQTSLRKEIEINEMCYQNIKGDLSALGFVVKTTIGHNDFCLFGKSLPDLYFYKDNGGNIVKAGLLKRIYDDKDGKVDEDGMEGVIGGMVEFKVSPDLKKFYPQMFADMVRLGCLLAHNALVRGKLVDVIQIFGLLVVHGKDSGIITKYHTNFVTEESALYIGDDTNDATMAFISIVHMLNNFK